MSLREGYAITVERGDLNYSELEPLYRQHYSELQARMAAEGIPLAEYNPRLSVFVEWWVSGSLVNFVLRFHGQVVGYSNIFVSNDMHNGEKTAREDTIWVLPEHRNGCGRELVKVVIEGLRSVGVKRFFTTAVTDLRAEKLWKRMGFKPVAQCMTYTF